MKQSIDFEKFNPFRRPDWRLERVLQMVDRMPNPGRSTKRDDAYVKGLRNFILRYRGGDDHSRNRLAFENAGLYWAYQIHDRRSEEGQYAAVIIEARLLAQQNDEEISNELNTLPEVVHWYESLFFNVRDRLKSYDWIVNSVLVPAYANSRIISTTNATEDEEATPIFIRQPVAEPFFDSTLKFFAYFGGPFVLDYVLTGFRRGSIATAHEQVGDWFNNHFVNRIKHRSSAASQLFEVNKYNVMQLFEINNQIIAIEKNAANEHQTEDQLHKAISGMIRELKWAAGKEGARLVQGTPIQAFDEGAAELRDDELLLLAAGEKPVTIEGVEQMTLPAPRIRTGQEDQAHANPQQGS